MAAKAAVRDVGRALNVPYNEVDKAAKMIPYGAHNLEEAIKLNPDLKTLAERSARTAELLQMAMKVEGMPRHASTHAAGVVISREPLTRYVPLQEGSEQTALTQYSMENLESIGLLKMDFLGLRTLSIIQRTVRWIEEQYGVAIDFQNLPMDDEPTYELLSKGDTTGIFQLESAGMRRVLKELRPSEFEDIVSVLALYRPGPMEFIPKYIAAKHQQIEAEYPHPDLEPILADTYGIIVYQEQIMQIASRMAGFSLGESDLLRRAVSKKKARSAGRAAGAFRGRQRRSGVHGGRGEQGVRHDRPVRGLRLPPGARDRIRGARFPDGLPEGAFSGAVYGFDADRRSRQPQENGRVRRRMPPDGDSGASSGCERERRRFYAGGERWAEAGCGPA